MMTVKRRRVRINANENKKPRNNRLSKLLLFVALIVHIIIICTQIINFVRKNAEYKLTNAEIIHGYKVHGERYNQSACLGVHDYGTRTCIFYLV